MQNNIKNNEHTEALLSLIGRVSSINIENGNYYFYFEEDSTKLHLTFTKKINSKEIAKLTFETDYNSPIRLKFNPQNHAKDNQGSHSNNILLNTECQFIIEKFEIAQHNNSEEYNNNSPCLYAELFTWIEKLLQNIAVKKEKREGDEDASVIEFSAVTEVE